MSVTSKEVINDENSTGNNVKCIAMYRHNRYILDNAGLPGGGHKRFPHLLPSLKPRDSLRGEDSSFEQEMEVRSSLRQCLMLDIATSRRLIVSRSILR